MKRNPQSRKKAVPLRIQPVARTSISEEIARQIIMLIATGDLLPSQRLLSERELCEQIGASRSSLREALRCLSIVGVLNARFGAGTSVSMDGEAFLRRIVEWPPITENMMSRISWTYASLWRAFRLRMRRSVQTRRIFEKFQDLIAKMKLAGKDVRKFAILGVEFHVVLAKATGECPGVRLGLDDPQSSGANPSEGFAASRRAAALDQRAY